MALASATGLGAIPMLGTWPALGQRQLGRDTYDHRCRYDLGQDCQPREGRRPALDVPSVADPVSQCRATAKIGPARWSYPRVQTGCMKPSDEVLGIHRVEQATNRQRGKCHSRSRSDFQLSARGEVQVKGAGGIFGSTSRRAVLPPSARSTTSPTGRGGIAGPGEARCRGQSGRPPPRRKELGFSPGRRPVPRGWP
jgi:hypothetical protein